MSHFTIPPSNQNKIDTSQKNDNTEKVDTSKALPPPPPPPEPKKKRVKFQILHPHQHQSLIRKEVLMKQV